jgi:hypothetical protein
MSAIIYNLVTSFIDFTTDILLKVALNTNKTGYHVIRYNWHIVESGTKHQYYWSPCYTLYLTLNITILYIKPDTLLKLVLNTKKSGHHVVRTNKRIIEIGVKHQ